MQYSLSFGKGSSLDTIFNEVKITQDERFLFSNGMIQKCFFERYKIKIFMMRTIIASVLSVLRKQNESWGWERRI
jgi:hypothetical protein